MGKVEWTAKGGEEGRGVVRCERMWNVSIDCSWAVLRSVLVARCK
jgi:hypothetical protein